MTRNRERKKKDISDVRGIQKNGDKRKKSLRRTGELGKEGREGEKKSVKGSDRAEKRPMCIVSPPTLI